MRPRRIDDRTLAFRDIVDSQLTALDGHRLGRATDIEAVWEEDGRLVLRSLQLGPEAHAGRILPLLGALAHRLLRGRFEHAIRVDELQEIGPTLRLAKPASDYDVGDADRWIIEHVLRWIPGSGR